MLKKMLMTTTLVLGIAVSAGATPDVKQPEQPVQEKTNHPATMFLFGTGLVGIVGISRRKVFKNPLQLNGTATGYEPVRMQVQILSGGPFMEAKMFENIKEAVRDLRGKSLPIELSEVKELVEMYFLQELKKGEHADDIDFDFMDMAGEILDHLSTNEEMYRVEFKNSTYFKEKIEGKDGKREV